MSSSNAANGWAKAVTDGWASVRAGQALFMTTTARWGRGSSVNSTQMDAAEAVG